MAAAITDEYSFAGTAGTAMTCTQPFRATLRGEGIMTVHSSHVLCRIFGQHLEPASGGRFATPMRSLTYALLPALQLNDQLLSGGVLLYIKPARVSRLLMALSARDDNFTSPATGWMDFRQRVVSLSVSLDLIERALSTSDVVVVPAQPDTWLGKCTPQQMGCTTIDSTPLADFLSFIPDAMTIDGLATESCEAVLALMSPRDTPSAANTNHFMVMARTIAAFVAMRPPRHLMALLPYNTLAMSVAALFSKQDGFKVTFIHSWPLNYPVLAEILGTDCPANMAWAQIIPLCAGMDIAVPEPSDGLVQALCLKLGSLKGLLLAEFQSGTPTSVPERTQAIMRLHRTIPGGQSQGTTPGGPKGPASEDMSKLAVDPNFIKLRLSLEALQTTSHSTTDQSALLASAESPVGLMFLRGRNVAQSCFEDLLPTRTKEGWPAIFDLALANPSPDKNDSAWQDMLPRPPPGEPHVATLLIQGEFAKIKDWAILGKEYLAKTMNSEVYMRLPPLPDQDPVNFWLSDRHLETLQDALTKIFKAIGFEGSRSLPGSFAWFLSTCKSRATDLNNLPTCNAKFALYEEAKKLIRAAISDITSYCVSFNKAAVHLAKRRLWVEQAGTSWIQNGFNTLDARIIEVNKDHRVGVRGLAAHQSFSFGNTPPVPPHWPITAGGPGSTPPSNPPSPYAVTPWSPTPPPNAGGAPPQAPPAQHNPRTVDPRYPPGVYHFWGSHACRHGIVMSNNCLVFGTTKCVNPPCMPVPGACLAPWAPNSNPANRGRWCTTPEACAKVGLNAHVRPGGHPEDSFKFEADCFDVGEVIIPALPKAGHAAFVPTDHPMYVIASATRPAGGRKGGKGRGRGHAGQTNFRRPPHRGV